MNKARLLFAGILGLLFVFAALAYLSLGVYCAFYEDTVGWLVCLVGMGAAVLGIRQLGCAITRRFLP